MENMKLKKSIVTVLMAASLWLSNPAFAGSCGGGIIQSLNEGGWANQNHPDTLLVKIRFDESRWSRTHTDAFQGFIRFDANNLPAERLANIRRAAYLAMATGKAVNIWSASGSCADASDLTVWAG